MDSVGVDTSRRGKGKAVTSRKRKVHDLIAKILDKVIVYVLLKGKTPHHQIPIAEGDARKKNGSPSKYLCPSFAENFALGT